MRLSPHEAKMANAIDMVNKCRFRGGPSECKCNGKRKCGKGYGLRGEVGLNHCIDCVTAGKNR